MGLCARSEDGVEGELLVLHLGRGGKTTARSTSLEEKCRVGLSSWGLGVWGSWVRELWISPRQKTQPPVTRTSEAQGMATWGSRSFLSGSVQRLRSKGFRGSGLRLTGFGLGLCFAWAWRTWFRYSDQQRGSRSVVEWAAWLGHGLWSLIFTRSPVVRLIGLRGFCRLGNRCKAKVGKVPELSRSRIVRPKSPKLNGGLGLFPVNGRSSGPQTAAKAKNPGKEAPGPRC